MYTYLLLILVLGIVGPVQLDPLSQTETNRSFLDGCARCLSRRLDNLWASGGGDLLLIRASVQVKSGKRIARSSCNSHLAVGDDLAAADTLTLSKLLGPVGHCLAVGLRVAHVVAVLTARG